ncbi:hypothetical protein [Streptomyces sp. NPDC097619]
MSLLRDAIGNVRRTAADAPAREAAARARERHKERVGQVAR